MYNIFFSGDVNNGCIAQSVERWSNKPLVMGSSPIVTIFFFLGVRVAFVAERLRRYVQVVVNFVGVGSSPTECNTFFFLLVPYRLGEAAPPVPALPLHSTLDGWLARW